MGLLAVYACVIAESATNTHTHYRARESPLRWSGGMHGTRRETALKRSSNRNHAGLEAGQSALVHVPTYPLQKTGYANTADSNSLAEILRLTVENA